MSCMEATTAIYIDVVGLIVLQVGSFGGIMDEVQALKRDKNVLMLELVRLRQQQQVGKTSLSLPAVLPHICYA